MGSITKGKSTKAHSSYGDLSLELKLDYFIEPKLAIGANIELPDTCISNINPEIYISPRILGASINIDINTFFIKLESNFRSRIVEDPLTETAITLGVNF